MLHYANKSISIGELNIFIHCTLRSLKGHLVLYRLLYVISYRRNLAKGCKKDGECKLNFRLPTLTASEVVVDQSRLEKLQFIRGRYI